MLSMLMVSAAEEGTLEIEKTYEEYSIDLVVEYDAEPVPCYGTKYIGEFDIEGTVDISGESYNAEFDDSSGEIWLNGDNLKRMDLTLDGKIYQNGETGYLYKDENNKYYGYIESGYYLDGDLYYQNRVPCHGGEYLEYDVNAEGYSKYVVTKSKPRSQFTLSSPPLGLGYEGSIAGDSIPQLYTYRDTDTWERVISETYPTDHDGPVIITPARIAGEPLQETGYWDTAKGQRVSEWKANNN